MLGSSYVQRHAHTRPVLIVHGRVDQSSILSNLAECDCHMDYLAGTGSPQVPLKEKLYYIVRVQVEMQIWERGCGEDFGDEKRQHQEHHPEQDPPMRRASSDQIARGASLYPPNF